MAIEDYSKMKKVDLVAEAESRGLDVEGMKNDLIREELHNHDQQNLPYDCDTCTWFRPNGLLTEFNMPGLPEDRADICKYVKSQLLVKVRGCPHYKKDGELSMTSDARINAQKRRAIGEE
jgi:hypothetical protein